MDVIIRGFVVKIKNGLFLLCVIGLSSTVFAPVNHEEINVYKKERDEYCDLRTNILTQRNISQDEIATNLNNDFELMVRNTVLRVAPLIFEDISMDDVARYVRDAMTVRNVKRQPQLLDQDLIAAISQKIELSKRFYDGPVNSDPRELY